MSAVDHKIIEALGEEKIVQIRLESMANHRAAAVPLPGPALDAFSGPIKVGAFTVRNFVGVDWVLIQKLDSPLYRLYLELQKPEKEQEVVEWTEDEKYTACWQFTTDIRQAERLVLESIQKAKESAKELFGYAGGEANELIVAVVVEQFTKHLKTRLQYAGELKESGAVNFFHNLTV